MPAKSPEPTSVEQCDPGLGMPAILGGAVGSHEQPGRVAGPLALDHEEGGAVAVFQNQIGIAGFLVEIIRPGMLDVAHLPPVCLRSLGDLVLDRDLQRVTGLVSERGRIFSGCHAVFVLQKGRRGSVLCGGNHGERYEVFVTDIAAGGAFDARFVATAGSPRSLHQARRTRQSARRGEPDIAGSSTPVAEGGHRPRSAIA